MLLHSEEPTYPFFTECDGTCGNITELKDELAKSEINAKKVLKTHKMIVSLISQLSAAKNELLAKDLASKNDLLAKDLAKSEEISKQQAARNLSSEAQVLSSAKVWLYFNTNIFLDG